eukprot:1316276-Amorphochlora_amoeboformis.AAC.2
MVEKTISLYIKDRQCTNSPETRIWTRRWQTRHHLEVRVRSIGSSSPTPVYTQASQFERIEIVGESPGARDDHITGKGVGTGRLLEGEGTVGENRTATWHTQLVWSKSQVECVDEGQMSRGGGRIRGYPRRPPVPILFGWSRQVQKVRAEQSVWLPKVLDSMPNAPLGLEARDEARERRETCLTNIPCHLGVGGS